MTPSDDLVVSGRFTKVGGLRREGLAKLHTSAQTGARTYITRDEAGGVHLSFPALSGIHYHLESAASFPEPAWTLFRSVTGDGNFHVVEVPVADSPAKYIRIRSEE